MSTTRAKQLRVAGHTLRYEGTAHYDKTCLDYPCPHGEDTVRLHVGKEGHALCSCGKMSPHLLTTRARRRWHRGHKVEESTV